MNLPLVLLHLRRGLHPGLGLALLVVTGALLAGGGPPLEAGLGAMDPEQVLRGLTRSAWWSALAFVLLLGAVTSAAGEHGRWQRGEVLWSSTRRLGPLGLTASAWAGRTLALWVWLAAIALGVELAAGDSSPAYQPGPRQEPVLGRLDTRDSTHRWSLAAPSTDGVRLSVELRWRGDYTAADEVELRVARRGAPATRLTRPPSLTQSFELALPTGDGPLDFELVARGASGGLAVELLEVGLLQPRSERLAAWRLALSLGIWGATLLALALGLGAWMSVASTSALLGVAWGVAWLERAAWPVPGLELPAELEALAGGRVPAPLAPEAYVAAAGLVALGLLLRLAAVRRGAGR